MRLVETSHPEHGFTLPGYNEICSQIICTLYIGDSGQRVLLVSISIRCLAVAVVLLQDHCLALAPICAYYHCP
jgi:hypothetical protein